MKINVTYQVKTKGKQRNKNIRNKDIDCKVEMEQKKTQQATTLCTKIRSLFSLYTNSHIALWNNQELLNIINKKHVHLNEMIYVHMVVTLLQTALQVCMHLTNCIKHMHDISMVSAIKTELQCMSMLIINIFLIGIVFNHHAD